MKRILAVFSIICLLLTMVYTTEVIPVADSLIPTTFVQSFEDDSLSLSNGNFSFSSEEARSGSKSLKLVKDSSSSTDNSFAAVFLNETDRLIPDVPYIVSFYIKPVTVSGSVELQFFRNSTVNSQSGNNSADRINKFNLTSSQIADLPVDENGWYKVVVSSEYYIDSAKPYMNFWNCQWDGAATVYFDDITFEPITAPEITENLINVDSEHWSFGEKYGSAGFDDNNIKVSGGTGIATFIGKTVKNETIRIKLNSDVTQDWAGIAFRNQADINSIKADGQNAYFYDIGNSYVVQWTKTNLSLKRNFKEGDSPKWENMVDAIDFNMQDGKDHTIEIKTTDDSENNKTYIEVYIDGILRLSATDTISTVKDAGYVQVVASGESDSVTVKGFEIEGFKIEDFIKKAPTVSGNNLVKNTNSWFFNKGWMYDGYTGITGFKDDNITVSGDYGTALFKGAKLGSNYAELKFKTNLSQNGVAFIGMRNAVTESDLETDGNLASALSEKANAYILRVMKTGVVLGVRASNGNFTPLGTGYTFEDGFDINAQENTVITRITDDATANSSVIEVWFNGKCIIEYTDTEYAIKPEGYYSVTVADNKNNSDYLTVMSLKYDKEISDIVLEEDDKDSSKEVPTVQGNNLVKNTNSWFFNKGWMYDGYTGITGFKDDNITVSGDYGTALFKGAKLGGNYAELKFKTNLSNNGVAFIGMRNAVTESDLERDKNLASALSEKANAYILRVMKTGVVLGVRASNGNFTPLGTGYTFEDGFDVNAQENTVITRISDDTATNSSVIEVWFNGKCVIEYTDTEYAIKPEGYYSVTVADNKNNSDYFTVTSLKYDKEISDIVVEENDDKDFSKEVPTVQGNNLVKNRNSWFFNKGWMYDRYTGTTGFKDDNITISGDYGTALFKGAKLGGNYAELKFKTNLSNNGVAFIGLRNAVTESDLERDKNLASALSEKANAYILRVMNKGVVLGVRASNGNFTPLGTGYTFEDGFDINEQENTVITRISDDTTTNSSVIEVWFNGKCVIEYTDTEYAIKPEGYYSVTVADNKNNSDYFTVTSLKYDKEISDIVVDVYVPATEIKENLLSADSQNWIFGREWAPNTGINNGTLTVTGGTGIATFTGKKVGTQSILFKLATNLKSEWAAVAFRNQVDIRELEKNGQNGYFMSSGNAYALVFTKEGVSIKAVYEKDKWISLGDTYKTDPSDGKEHLYEIVTEDIIDKKITKIDVYIDGELCISTVDKTYAIKDSGYVSFVCSNKTDSITVNGFEIIGEQLSTYKQGSPKVDGINAVKETANWYFNKGWLYEGYTGTTGVSNGNVVVSGDYGTALYKGKKIGQNYVETKFKTKLTDKGMIFIGLRNQVTDEDIEKDKYAASSMSNKANGYVIRIMKNSIALGIKGEDGNFKTLGTKYEFKQGFDINAQLNTLTTRILDDVDTKSSRIEIWFNGERIMVYIDEEHAIKNDGFYSITVADSKSNVDNITVSSLKIGKGILSPQTGDESHNVGLFVLLSVVLSLGVMCLTVLEREKYEE